MTTPNKSTAETDCQVWVYKVKNANLIREEKWKTMITMAFKLMSPTVGIKPWLCLEILKCVCHFRWFGAFWDLSKTAEIILDRLYEYTHIYAFGKLGPKYFLTDLEGREQQFILGEPNRIRTLRTILSMHNKHNKPKVYSE